MKYYYIDDSFFRPSPFLREMGTRFFRLCRRNQISLILISCADPELFHLQEFIEECSNEGIQVLLSPASFDYNGVKGVLTTTQLTIEGNESVSPYSGSVLFFDSEQQLCERIYLELFPNHSEDDLFHEIGDEIEKMLNDLLKKPNNKNPKYN